MSRRAKEVVGKIPSPTVQERFRLFAATVAHASGSAWTFGAAVVFLLLWLLSYPLFLSFKDPLDTWQLVINTGTTIVTFLMVFLIQNAQNRDAKALHLKLDELIRAAKGARNRLVELEDCTDEEIEALRREFQRIHRGSKGAGRRPRGASEPVTAAAEDEPPKREKV